MSASSPVSQGQSIKPTKKRVRRPNQTFPFTHPPDEVERYHRCDTHELYSLHQCPKCVVQKREATMIARHGVRSALHSKTIMEKKNETCIDRYQTKNPATLDEMKQKTMDVNLKKYGVKHTLQVQALRDKGKKTMMEKYGVEHALQNPALLQKRVQTNIEQFGSEAPLQNKDILEKRKKTNLERYQVEELFKSKTIQNQIQRTLQERYQVDAPLQNAEIRAKKDATCLERYGNSVIMHVPELFERKTVNSFSKKTMVLPSGNNMIYQGYEDVAIRELLKTHSEEEFTNDVKQMPAFVYSLHGKNHRYYPDLFLPKEGRFIEVKSPYTYLHQREVNQIKRECILQQGYAFEFWICTPKEILYRTQGWDRDEDVPWNKAK